MVTRYVTETSYPEGLTAEEKTLDKAIIVRTPYEITESQDLVEAVDAESREANDDALVWYSNIDNMGVEELRGVVKMLLGRHIAKHREQYIRIV